MGLIINTWVSIGHAMVCAVNTCGCEMMCHTCFMWELLFAINWCLGALQGETVPESRKCVAICHFLAHKEQQKVSGTWEHDSWLLCPSLYQGLAVHWPELHCPGVEGWLPHREGTPSLLRHVQGPPINCQELQDSLGKFDPCAANGIHLQVDSGNLLKITCYHDLMISKFRINIGGIYVMSTMVLRKKMAPFSSWEFLYVSVPSKSCPGCLLEQSNKPGKLHVPTRPQLWPEKRLACGPAFGILARLLAT